MNELQIQQNSMPMTADQIKQQVDLIQDVMRKIMKEDVHFGKIPGCGDKPALLKPGAEKICLTFRLALKLDMSHVDLPGGHREYRVKSYLVSPSGAVVGEGLGVCSTMESKYRYRWDATGKQVPQNYWDDRDTEKLGGSQFSPRKVGGKWMIYQRAEHDNPADYYNTCAKMAKKRAHVDVTLTTTAASDIFEQDIEEMVESGAPINENTAANRPGKQAVNKAQAEGDPERRAQVVANLEAVAGEGMERLIKTWSELPEDDRALVGADFGRIKKLAEKAA